MLQCYSMTQYLFRSGCCQKGDTYTEGISKFSEKGKDRTQSKYVEYFAC